MVMNVYLALEFPDGLQKFNMTKFLCKTVHIYQLNMSDNKLNQSL